MLLLRRIIFYIFLCVYLVLCPALILYCLGYIINPLTRQVEQTGLIHVATIPPGATVYLEHSRFVNKTPSTIDKLLPGQYRITLAMPEYRPWSQLVKVEPGKAAAFDNILLIPNAWKIADIDPGPFKQMIPLPGTEYVLVAREPVLGSYALVNWKTDKMRPLVGEDSLYYDFPVLNVYHEDQSRVLIIYGGGLWGRKYLYVDLKSDEPVVTDITKLLPASPLLIKWDPQDPNDLYAIYANYIDRIDVTAQALYPKFLEDVKGCGFSNKRIFLMGGDNSLAKLNQDKTKKEPFLETILFDKTLLGKNVFYHITSLNDNPVFLLSEDGQLLTNLRPFQLEEKGLAGMKYNERAKALLFWNAATLKTARITSGTEEDPSRMMALDTVYDKGSDIRQAFWVLNDRHMVMNDNDQIYLLEVEPQGANHVEYVANMRKGTAMFYTDSTGYLYFLDEAGRLKKLQVVPNESVVGEILSKGY